MFRACEIWKHKNCLDIRLLFVKIIYAGPYYVRAKVLYTDARGNVYNPEKPDKIRIMRQDFKNWTRCEE